MIRMSTGHTLEFAPCLRVTRFCVPTRRTPLTDIGSGNLYHLAALIAQHLIQLAPTCSQYPTVEARLLFDVCAKALHRPLS